MIPTTLAERPPLNLDVVDDSPPAEDAAPGYNTGDNKRGSWRFSLQAIRANVSHCSPEGQEAIVAVFLWCIDVRHPVHFKDFCRRVDYSENVLWKVMSGKYRNPDGQLLDVPKPLLKNIRDFLSLEKERYGAGTTEFVETPTAKRIFTLCDLARESQTPAFIWGPSHCGKTWALEHYASSHNHGRTVYCRMRAASGLGGMVRELAQVCGISDNTNVANMITYLQRAITSDMLVILDEVHLLMYTYRKSSFFACLEVLRELYDRTQCGMIIAGTRLLMEKIRGAQHAELEQLFNRGTHRLSLMTAPTRADLAAILKAQGLEFPDKRDDVDFETGLVVKGKPETKSDRPYEVLRQLATTTRLKAITERLRYARKFAAKGGTPLAWSHFLRAHHTITAQGIDETEEWS